MYGCSEYQRYKFLKAIHNILMIGNIAGIVVQNIKDTSFWKQFTTHPSLIATIYLLFRISKIQVFESNSQQNVSDKTGLTSCSEYQRYKFLKAIHNAITNRYWLVEVVQNIKDTSFWKQFTTIGWRPYSHVRLFRISKIQVFESNSQRILRSRRRTSSCSEYQRYKFLKAIHNVAYPSP